MDERSFSVGDAATTARLYRAPATRSTPATTPSKERTFVLAHGAGAGQGHPFMVAFAEALAARGIDVVTFDFLYVAAGRRAPDRNDKLEACWRAALALARAEWSGRAPFIGGKSMGGRIASQLAAAGEPCAGLICLGYPLHPPKQPDKLRTAHLPELAAVPTLILQGRRDPFGTPDELRAHFPPSTEIVALPGGHSFDDAAWPEAHARVAEFILR
ncbi:MAG TPA: alpha/beta fold hydrolase [Polyangia bacterium]